MKLGYAILADAAEVTSDGKLTIMGGNIDTINAPSFPALHERWSLVVCLLIQPEDLSASGVHMQETTSGLRVHQFRVECVEPDNSTLVFAGVVPIPSSLIDAPEKSELPAKLVFAVNSPPLVFRQPGIYRFKLYWDDQHLDDVPILLKLVEPNSENPDGLTHEEGGHINNG